MSDKLSVITYAAAKGTSGGGGGGTSNYNALENKPQIGGNELVGNKTASDLGLVAAENGKSLSTNDYDNAEKQKNADNATAVSAIKGDIASNFDATASYAVGDYVLKDGVLYKCTTAHTGAWDANDFTATTISDEIGDVETALSNKQDKLTFDDVPTDGSMNPVKSNGVYDALALKADASAVKNEFLGTLEQWNALTTAEKKEYDTYQITNDYTGGSGSWNYSTSEINTGQKWIDGKDIYTRTYTGLSITINNQWQNTGIDVSYTDTILTGFAIDNAKQFIVCSFGGTGSTLILRAYMSTNVITTVTIYYTKTA